MKKLLIIALTAILLATAASCRRESAGRAPFGWTSLGAPLDSMTADLEHRFYDGQPAESLVAPVNRFIKAIPPTDIARARALFWKGRLQSRDGDGAAGYKTIQRAIAMTDSAACPHDIARFRWEIDELPAPPDTDNLSAYTRLMHFSDLFRRCNDLPVAASYDMELSHLMIKSGMPDRAVVYAMRADSLLLTAGVTTERAGNRINIANALFAARDTAAAVEILHRLLDDSTVTASPVNRLLIDYNLWVTGRDTAALVRSWEVARMLPPQIDYRTIIASFMAEVERKRGRQAHASALCDTAAEGLPYLEPGESRAYVLHIMADTRAGEGRYGEATAFYGDFARTRDSINHAMFRNELIVRDTRHRIEEVERRAEDRRHDMEVRTWIILAAILMAAVCIGFIIRLRIQKLRADRLAARLESERAKRSEIAMTVAIQEKDAMLDNLREQLSGLVDRNAIGREAAVEIESAIKTSTITERGSEEFARLFTELSPDFSRRLIETYPGVGRSAVRLASYIAMGMDNSHIARVLNIRPESVKQARWRLRTQMQLAPGENLDTALRKLL